MNLLIFNFLFRQSMVDIFIDKHHYFKETPTSHRYDGETSYDPILAP